MGNGEDVIVPFQANIKADLGSYDYNKYRINSDSIKTRYTRSANENLDGKHIVFSALDRIYIKDLPYGTPRILIPQRLAQFQPVYSPDGNWIAYVTWCDTTGGSVWRISAAGGKPQQLTKIPGQYQRPCWSLDGKLIAVVMGEAKLGDRDDPGIGELQVIQLENGVSKIIADSIPLWNNLSFSANGRRIIYTPNLRQNGDNPQIVQIVSKDIISNDIQIIATGTIPEATIVPFYWQKIISPDGRYIVYSADEDLYLVPLSKLINPIVISDGSKHFPVIRFAEGVDPFWEKEGKELQWNYCNKFFKN